MCEVKVIPDLILRLCIATCLAMLLSNDSFREQFSHRLFLDFFPRFWVDPDKVSP